GGRSAPVTFTASLSHGLLPGASGRSCSSGVGAQVHLHGVSFARFPPRGLRPKLVLGGGGAFTAVLLESSGGLTRDLGRLAPRWRAGVEAPLRTNLRAIGPGDDGSGFDEPELARRGTASA